jgi:hypothetical protein
VDVDLAVLDEVFGLRNLAAVGLVIAAKQSQQDVEPEPLPTPRFSFPQNPLDLFSVIGFCRRLDILGRVNLRHVEAESEAIFLTPAPVEKLAGSMKSVSNRSGRIDTRRH